MRTLAPDASRPPARLWQTLGGAVLLVLAVGVAAAQTDRVVDAPLRFRHLGTAEGAANPDVTVLHQDRLGFLWVGTVNGLWRYDGARLRVFRPVPFDSTTLRDPWVSAIVDDGTGGLWVATESGGLHRYDPRGVRFRHVLPGAPNRIGALARRPGGALWVGTTYDGLLDVRPETGRPAQLLAAPEAPGALPSDEIDALLATRRGDLWVGTREDGLALRLAGSRAFRTVVPRPGDPGSVPGVHIRALHEDRQGRVWVGTTRGLARYDPAREAFVRYLTGDPARDDVRAVIDDPSGAIWVGSAAGLDRLDPATGARGRYRHDPTDPTSLGEGAVDVLAISRDGVLWTGGPSGVSYAPLAPPPLGHIAHDPADPNSLGAASVWMIYEDRAGTLWVGTGEGLDRVDRATGRVTRYASGGPSGLGPGEVGGIYEARDGTFWVSSRPGGLHRFDRQTGRVVERFAPDLDRPTGQHSEHPWWLLEDRRGRTWITSGGPGCLQEFHRETGTFTAHCHDPDDPDTPAGDFARYLIEGRDGTLWLGTWGQGLDRIDPETGAFTHYRHDPADRNTPTSDFILYLAEAADGTLWLGTFGGGMSRFDPATETFTHYTTHSSDLPDDAVYAILPDESGHVWVSTDAGLARLDPATGAARVFGLADGVQALEFNSNASFRSASGELFFGGINGINVVRPGAVGAGQVVVPVVVTGVEVEGRRLAPGRGGPLAVDAPYAERVRLGPGQRDVSFAVAALGYAARPRVRVRLEGYDDAWHDPGSALEATYTNLDPGRYTFRVQMASTDGTWAEGGASLAVVVAPRWFETWAFRLLAALALVGGGALALRTRERRRRQTERRLEAVVLERTEALRTEKQTTEAQAERLREMDRLKSRLFTNVSHEFRTPLTLTIGPLEDLGREPLPERQRRYVDLALRNSRRLLRLINQLLDVAKLEAGELRLHAAEHDLGAFVDGLARSFVPLAERRRVRFEVTVPPQPLPVVFDPEKLEQVVVNLLSNAFKFTPEGGAIRVDLVVREAAAEVRVRDSGAGIAAPDLPRVFDRFYQSDEAVATEPGSGIGLSLAKDLAELHGGALAVESTPGFGATFTLRLPLGPAPLAADPVAPAASAGDGRDAPRPALAPTAEQDDAPEPSGEVGDDRTTVLVADDNADIRAYIRAHLAGRYRVLEAPHGEAALALARAETPDLVLSDVMMPRLDGVGLVRALKADRETDFIPVVLLTAKAEEADVQVGLDAGADDYITKPFDVRTLLARVENLIASRQKLRARFGGSAPPATVLTPAPPDGPSAPDTAFVARVQAAIDARLGDEDLSVEDVAEAVGMSRSTLHRRLRAATGEPPITFLQRARLDHARAMLGARAGSVSEVAYAVGFRSVSHFSQAFRRRYGASPSAALGADAVRAASAPNELAGRPVSG